MKATLEFNLPEEAEEFGLAVDAGVMRSAIDETLRHIRNRLEYEEISDEVRASLEEVRSLLVELLK